MLDKYETFSEESIESAVVFCSMAPLFLSHRPARKMHLYHSPVRSSQIPAQMALLCSPSRVTENKESQMSTCTDLSVGSLNFALFTIDIYEYVLDVSLMLTHS